MKKTLLTILSLAAISLAGVNAQIVGFDFAGTTSAPWAPNTVDGNLTMTSGLTRVGLTEGATSSAFGSGGWNITNTLNESDDYISFSFTPTAGYQVSITELSWTRLNASGTAPGTGRWGYSIGGGAFTLQDTFAVPFASTAGNWATIGIVNATESVEFRFWAYGATSVNAGTPGSAGSVRYNNSVAGDDLVVNGSVTAVPEPSTVAFLGFSALGLCFYLWRRRRA